MSANLTQVGGTHYQAAVQHWDFAVQVLGDHYLGGNASKYLTRWRKKNGLQDLEKAQHYFNKLIEEVEAGRISSFLWTEVEKVAALEMTYQFLRANGIPGGWPEAEIIERLVMWRDVSKLYEARAILVDMIHDERERLAALPVLRSTRDQWGLEVALVTSKRSTCARRRVGCFLVDAHGNELATGYNGRAAGLPHCNEGHACAGATAPSGTALDACEAIHAEQNALIKVRDKYAIHTCYTTASPCIHCVKMLMNTGCQRIVFLEEYPHPEAKRLWESSPTRHGILDSQAMLVGEPVNFEYRLREWIKGSL